jgi:homoserine kinase type II
MQKTVVDDRRRLQFTDAGRRTSRRGDTHPWAAPLAIAPDKKPAPCARSELAARTAAAHIRTMAVYTPLHRQTIEAMVSVFPELSRGVFDDHAGVVDIEGIPQGSTNTTYRVTLKSGAVWYLRVNEDKPETSLAHERDVLDALHRLALGVVTPRMARSMAGGAFFAIDQEGQRRWASLFPALPGRDLGIFEVTPVHAAQIGTFLARAHTGMRAFFRRRRNPYGLPVVQAFLGELAGDAATAGVARPLVRELERLARRRRPLRAGLIHGDLFVDNTKWEAAPSGPRLAAVFDWEMAGRDHLAYDVAIVVCAWAFWRGDDGIRLVDDVAAAIIEAYQLIRPLSPAEKRGFFVELQLAALRFTASRMRAFETSRGHGAQRRYLDYRDYLSRLHLLQGYGERKTLARLGLRA